MNLTRVYAGISGERYAIITEKVRAETGILITGNSGEVTHLGVTISWQYSDPEQVLRVTLVHRDFFDPSAESILKQLDALVASTAPPISPA